MRNYTITVVMYFLLLGIAAALDYFFDASATYTIAILALYLALRSRVEQCLNDT